jgi:hypothetical protein
MQVAQVPKRRPILVAHALRKPRIAQPLIPRRLRHILQHAQSIADRLLPIGRHLPPLWQHIVPHMVALLRRHTIPNLRAIAQHLLLCWRHPPQPVLILQNPLPIRRRHILPPLLRIRRRRRKTIPVRLNIRFRTRNRLGSAVPRIWRAIVTRVLPRRRLRAGLGSGRPVLCRNHRSRHRQHRHRCERKRPAQAQPAPPLTEFAHHAHRRNSRLPSTNLHISA